MRPHQAVESFLPDFFNQPWRVVFDIPGQVLIARNTLLVAIGFVVASGGRCATGSVVTCVILSFVIATTANAWLCDITGSNVFVEGGLSLFVEVTEGLYC
jgi:hypothetical protein